jgi:hypothetical protein
VVAFAATGATACKRPDERSAGSTSAAASARPASATTSLAPLHVPRTADPMKLDGELNEPVWNARSARTGSFRDATGGEARPYSDARFLWDADNLYVALYAADDNLQATVTTHDGPVWIDDSFHLHLTPESPRGAPTYVFDINPAGTVMDAKRPLTGDNAGKDDPTWESGIELGVDKDGTLNNPSDMDEEWVVEARIPWKSMGIDAKPGTRVVVEIGRCDVPRGTKEKRCGAWGTPKDPRILQLD